MRTVDYYKILDVGLEADKSDIISSYRRLCKLYHPDINSDPAAEELMKEINIAYYILCDDMRREEYNNTHGGLRSKKAQAARRREEQTARAVKAVNGYFSALLGGDYVKAYEFLSDYDKQYVTLQSFRKWRRSVDRLFTMRSFTVEPGEAVPELTLDDGQVLPAKKHYVSIAEKNIAEHTVQDYEAVKFTVLENGRWSVFLGYRDLNEIAKMFEGMSGEREKEEKEKLWEEYCEDTCRELGMKSLKGFLKESGRELYRFNRYNQPIAVALYALYRVKCPASDADSDPAVSREAAREAIEETARELMDSLRETDIPAYLGGGVFAVLYAQLKRRHAGAVVSRHLAGVRDSLRDAGITGCDAECAYEIYTGGPLETYLDRLKEKIIF